MSLFSRLFGGSGGTPEPEPEVYKDFRIFPEPQADSGGFRIAGRIEKEMGGEGEGPPLPARRPDPVKGRSRADHAAQGPADHRRTGRAVVRIGPSASRAGSVQIDIGRHVGIVRRARAAGPGDRCAGAGPWGSSGNLGEFLAARKARSVGLIGVGRGAPGPSEGIVVALGHGVLLRRRNAAAPLAVPPP